MNVVNYTFPRAVLIVFYPFTQLFEKLNFFPKMILLQKRVNLILDYNKMFKNNLNIYMYATHGVISFKKHLKRWFQEEVKVWGER